MYRNICNNFTKWILYLLILILKISLVYNVMFACFIFLIILLYFTKTLVFRRLQEKSVFSYLESLRNIALNPIAFKDIIPAIVPSLGT